MNNNIKLDKIKFRWSTNFDKSKIKKNIIENFGYFPIAEGALKPVKNRYYLAFYENERINLFMPLSKNGFKPIEEGIYSYDKKYFKKCNECCRKNECIGCKSDLWLRK